MLQACLPIRRLNPLSMSAQEASQAEARQRMSCVAPTAAPGLQHVHARVLAGGPGGGRGAGDGRPGAQHQQHVLRQRGARADGAPAQQQCRQQPPPPEHRRCPSTDWPQGCNAFHQSACRGFPEFQLSSNAWQSSTVRAAHSIKWILLPPAAPCCPACLGPNNTSCCQVNDLLTCADCDMLCLGPVQCPWHQLCIAAL